MRGKLVSAVICGVLLAVTIPAMADICNSCGGGGSGSGSTTLNRLAVSNGVTFPSSSATPEGSDCQFTIKRLKPRTGITRVHWHTKDGSAVGGPNSTTGDYISMSGVAKFSPEQPSTIEILIPTNFDSQFQESFERFFLVITNPRNGAVIDSKGFCDIQNNPGD